MFSSDHYRQAAIAVGIGIGIRVLLYVPVRNKSIPQLPDSNRSN